MLEHQHRQAIEAAKTEHEKIRAAATAMIETPLSLIRHILQRHEESVLAVLREIYVENRDLREALRKCADVMRRSDCEQFLGAEPVTSKEWFNALNTAEREGKRETDMDSAEEAVIIECPSCHDRFVLHDDGRIDAFIGP